VAAGGGAKWGYRTMRPPRRGRIGPLMIVFASYFVYHRNNADVKFEISQFRRSDTLH
jgi:hypothetical protein